MKSNKVTIIAEAGVNHNGDINIAKRLIDEASKAGADFIKFQSFKTEKIVSTKAVKSDYQIKNTSDKNESQFEMLKKLELSNAEQETLYNYCQKKAIEFISSPFDLSSIDTLNTIGIELFKIPSGEITNLPYLEKLSSIGKPVILSTGMSNLGEIETALEILGRNILKEKIVVLHCNTEYPTPLEDVNLRAMNTIAKAFKVNVGYSDHTLGIEVAIAAVARGAKCIEKHFTLDKEMAGPDHKASLEPAELTQMIRSIRNIELALGSGIKKASNSEIKNKDIVRKSIFVCSNLKQGHLIDAKDLIMMRPGDGISPMKINEVIGKRTSRNISKGTKLSVSDFENH